MCKSTDIPAITLVESKNVKFLATEFKFPGIVKYPDDWNVIIQLDQDMLIYKNLLAWKQYFTSIVNNNGGRKTIPNAVAKVQLLDAYAENVVSTMVLHGIWIKTLDTINFEYNQGQANPTECSVTFTIQWIDVNNCNDELLDLTY